MVAFLLRNIMGGGGGLKDSRTQTNKEVLFMLPAHTSKGIQKKNLRKKKFWSGNFR